MNGECFFVKINDFQIKQNTSCFENTKLMDIIYNNHLNRIDMVFVQFLRLPLHQRQKLRRQLLPKVQ